MVHLMRVLLVLMLTLSLPAFALSENLHIVLDYRFDGGYFSKHQERRIPLEYAARQWEKVLKTVLQVDAGSVLTLRPDYTKKELTEIVFKKKSDGFVVFIYAYDFAKEVDEEGKLSPSTAKAFGGNFGQGTAAGLLRINTNTQKPWYFDTTPQTADDVPVNGVYDVITTAVHEFGHVLGFLRDRLEPFVKTFGDNDERFCGSAAMRVNDGEPVPLEFDSSHIRGDWWNSKYLGLPPIDRFVMHTSDPVQGYRQTVTAIDLAIMEDIGWEVDYQELPADPYFIEPDYRAKSKMDSFGISEETLNPSGLWVFDKKESVGAAVIGNPLRYSPPVGTAGGLSSLFVDTKIRVPKGGWLYCVPGLPPRSNKENEINRYTLVLDVNLPKQGVWYSLYNTSPMNANNGDFFISPDGNFGAGTGGYSRERLVWGQWVRLAIVVNSDKKSRRYYINGKFSHELKDVEPDGQFSLGAAGSDYPFFCLFADDDGEDGEILARRIILYGVALNDRQIDQLGDADKTVFGLH